MKKEYKSFEDKIKDLFKKYSRIPLLVVFVLFVFVLFGVHINISRIKPYRAKREIEHRLNYLVNALNDTIDTYFEDNQIDTDYSYNLLYYKLNQLSELQIDLAIYTNEGIRSFSSNTRINESIYYKMTNKAILSGLEDGFIFESISGLDQVSNVKDLVFGKNITKEGVPFFVLVYIDGESMHDYLNQNFVNQIILTDRFGYVVGSTMTLPSSKIRKFNDTHSKHIMINNVNYLDRIYQIYDQQIFVHSLILKQNFFINYGLLILFMGMIFTVIKVSNDLVGKRVGKEATDSINEIILLVDKIKTGALGYTSHYTADDELGYVIDAFNDMSRTLDKLIKRNELLLKLSNEAQIRQLEAQFNPHFLYNSLDTIRFLIYTDPQKASSLILDLTYLLRYSLDVNKSEVTFSEDLEYVYKYLSIIKTRLDDRFSYIIDIEPEVLESVVPRLLIQPLIENSIKHGFKNKASLEISIYGFVYDGYIYIGVYDSGSGMSKTELEKLRYNLENRENRTNHFGLYNLNQRIKLLYGERGQLRITSSEDGTNIVIRLPKEELDE